MRRVVVCRVWGHNLTEQLHVEASQRHPQVTLLGRGAPRTQAAAAAAAAAGVVVGIVLSLVTWATITRDGPLGIAVRTSVIGASLLGLNEDE